MRGNEGDKEMVTGEEDMHDERKSRGNKEVKGPEEATCLTLNPPDCTRRTPTNSQPTEGRPGCIECSRCPFHRTLFPLYDGPAPASVAFRCHFGERKKAYGVNSFNHEAFIRHCRSLACMLRSPCCCGGMHRLHQSPQGRSSSCKFI